jgi:hypothetical protein
MGAAGAVLAMRAHVDAVGERMAKLRVVLRDAGLPGVLDAAGAWMRHSEDYLRVRVDLTHYAPAAAAATSSFAITSGWGTELGARLAGTGPLPLEFCGRAPHRRFFLVMEGGVPAHITWALLPGDKSHFMSLTTGQAEITDCHTLAPFRGRGIFGAVLRVFLTDLTARGITSVFGHVLPQNHPSRDALHRAGFRLMSRVTLQRRFGRDTVTERESSPSGHEPAVESGRVGERP